MFGINNEWELILAIICIVWLLLCIIVPIIDNRKYNKGICRKCGGKIIKGAYDMYGSCLCHCEKCNDSFWADC